MDLPRLRLDEKENPAIRRVLDHLAERYSTVEDASFQRDLQLYAHGLPSSLCSFLNAFRLGEPYGVALISGLPVDDGEIGMTPAHWDLRDGVSPALRYEMFLLLCSALLGEPFAWSTQQDGYIVHDVIPIREHENKQLGTGCLQTLVWHTEDAFHPFRCDYIGLLCLRNRDRVPTTFACVDDLPLDSDVKHVQVLFEPRFYLQPDGSQLPSPDNHPIAWFEGGKEQQDMAYKRMQQRLEHPQATPILFGSPQSPYLCVDPFFKDLDRMDEVARAAYDWLLAEIDGRLQEVVLEPGDCLIVDNYKSVHGRNSFKARFDGTDRWLKRTLVTRDLRKSREARLSAESRIVF